MTISGAQGEHIEGRQECGVTFAKSTPYVITTGLEAGNQYLISELMHVTIGLLIFRAAVGDFRRPTSIAHDLRLYQQDKPIAKCTRVALLIASVPSKMVLFKAKSSPPRNGTPSPRSWLPSLLKVSAFLRPVVEPQRFHCWAALAGAYLSLVATAEDAVPATCRAVAVSLQS